MKVWVLVTYLGSHGDDVEVFAKREDAEASALAYALERWPKELGRAPSTYEEARDAWDEHDLWGAYDSRWELVEVPVK